MAQPKQNLPVTETGFAQATEAFADGLARICRLYGVNPLLGRLYALLFVAPEPLSLDTIAQRAGTAKSTVSVALRRLLAARVVQRLPPRSDLRDFYQVVADPWAVFADWNRLFLQPELDVWRHAHQDLERALATETDTSDAAGRAEVQRRVTQLHAFVSVVERLLGDVPGGRPPPQAARTIAIDVDTGAGIDIALTIDVDEVRR